MPGHFVAYLKKISGSSSGDERVKKKFGKRAGEGALTREENPLTHFCVYFAAYDPANRQVFIGLHKKSGLWLFNGGHIDKGEMPLDALEREVWEEWGERSSLKKLYTPSLLTITKIEHPEKQICRFHYDIWYFIALHQTSFTPDENLLAKEFHQTGWKTIKEAKSLIRDPNTLMALSKIEKLFRNE